jgi:hypothetical protein
MSDIRFLGFSFSRGGIVEHIIDNERPSKHRPHFVGTAKHPHRARSVCGKLDAIIVEEASNGCN